MYEIDLQGPISSLTHLLLILRMGSIVINLYIRSSEAASDRRTGNYYKRPIKQHTQISCRAVEFSIWEGNYLSNLVLLPLCSFANKCVHCNKTKMDKIYFFRAN